MLPSLVRKTVRDWRRLALGWAVGLAAFATIYVGFWANVRNNPDLVKLKTDSMPRALTTTFGLQDLTTGVGYLRGTVFGLIGPLLVCMVAIILGSHAIATPEDRHVMDLYLANPISRRAFVLQRAATLIAILLGFGLITWLIPLSLSQALHMGVSAVNVTAASTGLFLLGLLFGSLALATGAYSGRRATAVAVAGTVAVAGYVLYGLAQNVTWLRGARWASPFHYYMGSEPLSHGFSGSFLVLVAASVALLAMAVVGFDRRDVRV